ncbi:MAG: DUF2877 domain-containing protein [Actinomycetota bacterium]
MTRALAASASLVDLLGRAGTTAEVLASRRPAAYLTVGGRIVAAETSAGVGLPIAVVVDELPPAGATVDLATWTPGRWWDPAVPRIAPRPERVAELRAALGRLDPPEDDAVVAARGGDPDALVGLGSGSTPAGDDLLAGRLVALHALGDAEAAAELAAELRLDRTTPLSAELLRRAALGEASRPVNELLRAVERRTSVALELEALLEVGGTSGRWLAEGIADALHGR